MEERGTKDRPFSGQYLAIGLCFGFLWGLLLFGSNWFLGILVGMMIGAYLDWRKTRA